MRAARWFFPRPAYTFAIFLITTAVAIFAYVAGIPKEPTWNMGIEEKFLPLLQTLGGEISTDPGIVAMVVTQQKPLEPVVTSLPKEIVMYEHNEGWRGSDGSSAFWWSRHAIHAALEARPSLFIGGKRWIGGLEDVPQVMNSGSYVAARPQFRLIAAFPPNQESKDERWKILGEGIGGPTASWIFTSDTGIYPNWTPSLLMEAVRVRDRLPARSLTKDGGILRLGRHEYPISPLASDIWFNLPLSKFQEMRSYDLGDELEVAVPTFYFPPATLPNHYRSFQAYDVAAGRIPGSELRGTIIASSVSPPIFDAIYRDKILSFWPVENQFSYILLSGFLAAWIIPLFPGMRAVAAAFGGAFLLFAAPIVLLRFHNLLLPAVAPSAVWTLSGFFGIVVSLGESHHQRDVIKKLFGRYLSRQVMDAVLRKPDLMRLEGREEVLTVLVSDIRGFTTFAESLEASKVSAMLNEYFDAMIEIAFRNGGTLDKLIGDAIVVYFGNPVPVSDHSDRAVQTAIEMKSALAKLGEGWESRGLPQLENGIGIHTGNVFVGNVGADRFQSYTVIGENVQEAHALQTRAKKGEILISGETKRILSDRFRTQEIDGDGLAAFEVLS